MPTFYSYATIGISGPDPIVPAASKVMADAGGIGVNGSTTPTLALSNVTVAGGGTFDEAARNVDPGIANVKNLTTYKIQNVALTGTMPAGSLALPAIPTGFAVASIGSTKQRASWNMVPITGGPAATYDLSSDGVNADIASGIVGLSYDITGLTASTAYNRYVRATNDTGSSAWSAVVAATTSSANDFLTRIETALTSMLIVPRIANGFWFDWSTSTTRDFAQSLPTATSAIGWVDLVPVEESVDAEAQCDFNGYHNKISVEIYSAAALATTSNNPKESCKQVCSKMLEDIKKLMGTNLGASSAAQQAFWDEVASVEYKRSTILWADKSADVMIPGWLKTEFTIGYVQRRAEPTQSGI